MHCCEHEHRHLTAIDLSGWRDLVEKLAKDAYEGRLKPESINETLVRETYSELNKGAKQGFGKDWLKTGKDGLPDQVAIAMQQNLFKFSGAKTYAQLLELNNALTKGGKILSWNEFRTEALKLNSKYNVNYLQAEYQTAKQAGYHANNWQSYQENKKRYPNLKYRTQNDERVRDEHRALEGLVVPIDHPFWQSYYPPNGWRCRCFVEQTKEPADLTIIPEDVTGIQPEFRINTGISGQVFKEDGADPHKFFALTKESANKVLEKSLELSKNYAPPIELYSEKDKGRLTMSPFAHLGDLKKNVKSGMSAVTSLAVNIHINAHLDSNITRKPNPEYTINGNTGDRKEIKGYRGLMSSFDDLKEQNAVSVLFDLMLFKDWEANMFVRKLKGKIMSYPNYQETWIKDIIVEHAGKAVMFSAKDVLTDPISVIKSLKKLKAGQ